MKLTKINSFGFCYPHLLDLWSSKNSLSPYDVSCGSGKNILWQCPIAEDHEFSLPVYRITSGERCPFCSNHRASKDNCLEKSKISKEWDYSKNALSPSNFTISSRKKAHWICQKCFFNYEARIDHRTVSGSGCPNCRLKGQSSVNELLEKYFSDFKIYTQKLVFKDFYGKKRRYADFWLEKEAVKIWVEYDGEQHFKPVARFGGQERFIKQKDSDAIDALYSAENGVILCRIPYYSHKELTVKMLKDKIDMSYEKKIEQARILIDQFNDNVEEGDRLDKSIFEKKLKKLGGTTEESLSEATYEDIEDCGLPRILARKVATVFRAAAKVDPDYVSPKKASAMAALYLIQQYNPNEPDSVISKELNSRVSGKKFVVLNSGGSVNIEKTSELYNEIQKRWPERDFVEVDGIARRVFRVGEGKAELADESPIWSGRALRPDGTDDQLGRSWDGVPQIVRQLIYVAVNITREIVPNNQVAHDTLDMALLADGEKKLRQRCRKASVQLDELIEQGNAPKLKINRVSASNARSNDPFFQNNRTY